MAHLHPQVVSFFAILHFSFVPKRQIFLLNTQLKKRHNNENKLCQKTLADKVLLCGTLFVIFTDS